MHSVQATLGDFYAETFLARIVLVRSFGVVR